MSINIQKLNNTNIHQFTELIRVFEEVFEMKNFQIPSQKYLQSLLNRDDFFAFVALSDKKVLGGLTSYIMHQYYAEAPLVYIFDLAVKTEFQRKGIGQMLISGNNEYCKSIGVEFVMVEADEEDEHAIEFYRSTGAIGQKVTHFDYELNKNT